MKNLFSNGEFHYLVIALQTDYGAPVYIQILDYSHVLHNNVLVNDGLHI